MNQTQFEVNEQTYRMGSMSPFKQLHVARRIAPLVAGLGELLLTFAPIKQFLDGTDGEEEEKERTKPNPATLISALQSVTDTLARMPDTEVEYVLEACLGVVQRQQGDKWAPIFVPRAGLMFADITMPSMLQITRTVIEETLGDFFPSQPIQDLATEGAPST